MRSLIILLTSVLLFTGCVTEKKASRYYLENKSKLGLLCSSVFPPEHKYVEGETKVVVDSVVVRDTSYVDVPCPDGTKVPCPPCIQKNKTITEYKDRTDTLYVPDVYMVGHLQIERDKLENELDKVNEKLSLEKSKSKKFRNWLLVVGGIGILSIARKFF